MGNFRALPPALMMSLDAATYDNTTTGSQQNVSGTSDNVGFFPYGWPAYNVIQPGWTCVETGAVVSAVDGTAHTITTVGTAFTSGATYTFTRANTWFDSVNNLPFILQNGVTYDSGNGGSMVFVPSSSQYATSSTSLSSLNTWTVEAWHYYAGTNAGSSPCIITEIYPGTTGQINYALGSLNDNSPGLMAGWYNGGWSMTPYTLTAGNWYQIVGTYDGSHVKLYVNNTLVEQLSSTGNAISSNGGINLMRRWDNAEFWGGKLGIVNVYEGAMNQSQVAASWNANKARFGLASSFTLSPSDFTNYNWGTGLTPNGNTGFTTTGQYGPGEACYNPNLSLNSGGSPTKLTEIRAFWANNGLNTVSNAYMFNVTWGAGSTLASGVVIMTLYYYNDNDVYLNIGVVDTSNPIWQTSGTGYYNGPIYTLAGTWNFPATFTLITPLIVNGQNWC